MEFNETEFEVLDIKRKEMVKAWNDFKMKKIAIKYKLSDKIRNQLIHQIYRAQAEFQYEYDEEGIGRSKYMVEKWMDNLPKIYTKEQLYPERYPESWHRQQKKGDNDRITEQLRREEKAK